MQVNINQLEGKKTRHGIIKRTLLERAESETGDLEVNHYTLTAGGLVEFNSPDTEVQHYVIHGCATKNQPDGDLLHQDTAWFIPNNGFEKTHALCHSGEGEVRILSIPYKVPETKPWAKSRRKNVHEINLFHSGNRVLTDIQVFKEEEYAAMGAQKMHRLNMLTVTSGLSIPCNAKIEQVVYILTGTGILSDGKHVSTGSLVYKPEGLSYEIKSFDELNCIMFEFK